MPLRWQNGSGPRFVGSEAFWRIDTMHQPECLGPILVFFWPRGTRESGRKCPRDASEMHGPFAERLRRVQSTTMLNYSDI